MSVTPADTCPIGPNPNSNPGRHKEDRSRWLAIREDTVFLSDGILRSMGLASHPFDKRGDIYLGHTSSVEFDIEGLLKIGTSDAEDLQLRLHKLCRSSGIQMRTYHSFLHKVFKGMWGWKYREGRNNENNGQTLLSTSSSTSVLTPKQRKEQNGAGNMSSRVSLLLMVPLLKSQATMDSTLALTTANLLLEMLSELPPMSLSKEFQKPLDHLEELMEHWISEQSESFQSSGPSTMIGLCCARGIISSFLKTITLLQQVDSNRKLPVRKILKKLEDMKIRHGNQCAIQPGNYVMTIPYDDKLVQADSEVLSDVSAGSGSEEANWHVAASDGAFLFVSGSKGKGISKIGTGLHGTIQGYVYSVNQNVSTNFLAFGNRILIIGPEPDKAVPVESRPDNGKTILATVIDADTLNIKSSVWIRPEDDMEEKYEVLSVTSDGYYFYMLRLVYSDIETAFEDGEDQPTTRNLALPVYLDIFQIVESGGTHFFYPIRQSQLLRREADPPEPAPAAVPETRRSRAIRIVASLSTRSTQTGQGTSSLDSNLERMTSLGVKVKYLMSASVFCCGNYLTLLTDYAQPGPPAPSPLMQTLNRHFGGPTTSLHYTKLQGVQLHIALHNLGKKSTYSKQNLLEMPIRSSFQKAQVTLGEIACTYDARNNFIWTVNGDYMDAFRNPGHRPPWHEAARLMIRQTEFSSPDDLETHKVLHQLFTHIGAMAANFLSGDSECNIGFGTNTLKQLTEFTLDNARSFDGTALTSVCLMLQAIISQIKTPSTEAVKHLKDIQTFVLMILSDHNFTNTFPCDTSSGVYYEASQLFTMIFDHVYRTAEKKQSFIRELIEWIDDDAEISNKEILKILKNSLLTQFTLKLDEFAMNYSKGKKWIMNIDNLNIILESSIQTTLNIFDQETENYSVGRPARTTPVACPATLYIAAVSNCILKTWTNTGTAFAESREEVTPIFRAILNRCTTIVDRAIEFLSANDSLTLQMFTSVENILKSSLLGLATPQIFLCFMEMSVFDSVLVEEISEECGQLYVAISHLSGLVHEKGAELFAEMNLSEDWASKIEKPTVVQQYKVCESSHPVRDSCKLKETISFSGARRLYLKFDPRCSTQYDYDKLCIYAGPDTNSKRVAEYGGNFYGYGSRTGNPGYWPVDLIRIDGDTITYNFEVRSGREQHSPESTVWGFSFTVFPIFDTNPDVIEDSTAETLPKSVSEVKGKRPGTLLKQDSFIERLILLALDLMSCFVARLAATAPLSSPEREIQTLLSIPLLSYLRWTPTPGEISKANVLTVNDIYDMRKIAHNAEAPKMRVKMSEIIRPEKLQQLYVQLCLNCLEREQSLESSEVSLLSHDSVRSNYGSNPELLGEIFRGVDAIIRNLIALTEVQFRFAEEVDDFIQGVKSFQDAFFLDPNFEELDMINLAAICDITYDANNPANVISDFSSIVQAFIESGSRPQLTKAEEVVDEIFIRIKYLLRAEKRRATNSFWDCPDFRTAKRRIDQIQTFVAFPFDQPLASLKNILEAVKTRKARAARRSQGVQLLLKILECSKHFSQSLITVGLRLQHCVELKDITCTGYEQEIVELSSRAIKTVVSLASKDPPLYRYAIALLCILPYKRRDESCLLESGLLELLDQLCAFQPKVFNPTLDKKIGKTDMNNVGPLAWASFQVLAGRCSSWETTKPNDFEWIDTDHIALPVQISVNITNHLARATTLAALSSSNEDSDMSSPVDKVCGLLDTLRLTKLGQAILKQSPCICRLFSLLLDSRLSPRLVLTILRLLYTALPLVDNLDISDLTQINGIPILKKKAGSTSIPQDSNPYNVIASLLLSKLADFQVVCGNTPGGPPLILPSGSKNTEEAQTPATASASVPSPPPLPPAPRPESVPKKLKSRTADQSCKERNLYLMTHDPARNFLSGEVAEGLAAQIIRLLRLLLSTSMTPKEETRSSFSRGNVSSTSNSSLLSSMDEDMEFIPEPTSPSVWSSAVEQVLCSALKPLAKLSGLTNPAGVVLESYATSARLVLASLSVLGSFNETIRVSSICWILSKDDTSSVIRERGSDAFDWDFLPTKVQVRSVCDRTGIATVEILRVDEDDREIITPSNFLDVPISRLSSEKHPKWEVLPPLSVFAQREIAGYLRSLFLPLQHAGMKQDLAVPLKRQLPTLNQIFSTATAGSTGNTTGNPSESRTIAHGMTIVRLVAEVRTRAAQVCSIWLRRKEFVQIFLGLGSEIDIGQTEAMPPEVITAVLSMKALAKECKASYRLENVENQVTRLRLLYRDCTKPPKLVSPSQSPLEQPATATTSSGPSGPSNRSATAPAAPVPTLTVTGASSESGFRLRRISDSLQDLNFTQFYPHLGDIDSESEVSFAVADAGSDEGGSSGYGSPISSTTAVNHYDMLEDQYEEDDDSSGTMPSDPEDELPPLVEVQVQSVQVPVVETPPAPLRITLPTAAAAEASPQPKKPLQTGAREATVRGHVAKPKPENKEYSPSSCLEYHLTPSATYDIRVFSGPNRYICPCSLKLGTELDLLSTEQEKPKAPAPIPLPRPRTPRTTRAESANATISSDGTEDIHELLLRAWEQRVFPTIRRRFRNESERRDGLEQIKGALLMGMIDIARQTVEFLYEENGGIPRDLHLPTLEEIKAEASRFTMDRIKVGMNVMIRSVRPDDGEDISGSIIPKFAVGSMLRTFGLVGEVLDVDPSPELVLVEVYVETEGNLMRFWYPIKCLERVDGSTKPTLNAHSVNMFQLHSNLVALEVTLAQLYCRAAFLQVLNTCNVDTLETVSTSTTSSPEMGSKRSRILVSALEELDLENLQLRSEHGFADFPLNGDLLTWNLGIGVPPMKFLTDLGNPSVIFYRNCTKLTQELNSVIERAARKGMDALNLLTQQICAVFENAPEKFVTDEIHLDKEGEIDVVLPDTAFTVISVRCPPTSKPPTIPSIKEPCVHIYGMNGGELKKYALACYPIQSLSSLQKGNLSLGGGHSGAASSGASSGSGRDILKRKNAFPTILIPTDRISCTISQQTLPGYILQVQGIPAEFPLALLYCQQLIQFIRTRDDMSRDIVPSLVSMFLTFLQKTSMPPVVKEWVFALISETINVNKESILTQDFYSAHFSKINRLFTELVILYEHETKSTSGTRGLSTPNNSAQVAGTTPNTSTLPGPSRTPTNASTRPQLIRARAGVTLPLNPPNRAIGTTEVGKLDTTRTLGFHVASSYFQLLLELCMNLAQTAELMSTPSMTPSLSSEPSPSATPIRKSSGVITFSAGPHPQASKGANALTTTLPARKIMKPFIRTNQKAILPGKKGTRTPYLETKAISPRLEGLTLKGCLEMPFFRHTVYAAKALKTLVRKEGIQENIGIINQLVQDCMESLFSVTSHTRLFVIVGAPNKIETMPIETSAARALSETGGIYGNEIWISDVGLDVVLEVRTACKADKAFEILKRNQTWYPKDEFLFCPDVSVYRVKNNLETGDRLADQVLSDYLRQKIFQTPNSSQLSEKANEAVSNIFTKCYMANEQYGNFDKTELDESGAILLRKKHIFHNSLEGNVMEKFVQIVKPVNFEMDYFLHEVFKKFGQPKEKDSCEKSLNSEESSENLPEPVPMEAGLKKTVKAKVVPKDVESPKVNFGDDDWGLSLFGFIGWCTQLARDNICALWRAFLETGHDFRLDKVMLDSNEMVQMMTTGEWTKEQDAALVNYVDELAQTLRLTPQNIHPHEIYLEENNFLNPELKSLRNIPIENIRSRFAVLQSVNQMVYHNLLPYVPLHIGRSMRFSMAALLHDARYFLFYNTKDDFLYKVLLHSALRGADHTPPDVVLDPILRIGSTEVDSRNTLFSQAVCQLNDVPSSLLCVPPATGGDPPLPVVVKFSGEEVQGLIGSFRHFLGAAVEEFKKPDLNMLMLCPSSAAGQNKDSLMLRPGPLSYGEERLMNCLGQFMGICLRADSPMSLPLLRSAWRHLLNSEKEFTDSLNDLKEADILTHLFLQAFNLEADKEAFQEVLEEHELPRFQYPSLDGRNLVQLCPYGYQLPVNYDNKEQFIRLIQRLRDKELSALNRVSQILPGLASIIPVPIFFNMFTTTDLRLRVSGPPEINLALLKSHTHYQVGLSETDRHILFFWAVLEAMTPDELKNFIKFATNQERLPASCPCQNHVNSSTNPANIIHVPPFPMKIAPIDMPHGASDEYINRRTIRAETCLFLVRLPPYTTYQVTRDQLLFACNSRDDPLSG